MFFLIVFNPVAAYSADPPPAFIQGFETDTSGWFPRDDANVGRVPSGDQSLSYNSGTTSQYGDGPVNAATGSYFGRVTSAVSASGDPATGSCILESVPGGDALLCTGPFTYFGIKPSPADPYPAHPFPPGGYTTQVDIYLDQNYAGRHQDCGVFGPCTPLSDPPVLNPACDTDPNGINCEGSRFNWTVGVSRPDASFLQDYVFSVGLLLNILHNSIPRILIALQAGSLRRATIRSVPVGTTTTQARSQCASLDQVGIRSSKYSRTSVDSLWWTTSSWIRAGFLLSVPTIWVFPARASGPGRRDTRLQMLVAQGMVGLQMKK
ncbi:hypothetical protein [Candidatus Nitrotoga fabula]|uniref:Uncharacterized protein n=1 Tax=Candidatus Nitrotoga fabula TaxID=2182327 RepID=A0A916FAE2_9PROT|nr:hypothetical protein [Candidatus Nitrotoga fabula]CAE6715748.1 hypothetical protein NTGZN8_260011 [Candidatus Nitrotoga fabula]